MNVIRMRTARTIAISLWVFVLIILTVCFAVLKSGALSAHRKPGSIEYAIANYALKLSIPTEAKNAKNPVQPSAATLDDANKSFSENCAVCHANDGTGKTDTARGLSPEVPSLAAVHVQSLTDGEMFYIIKNGIRFTGMPGWSLPDKQIWEMVLLIRQFSKQSTLPEASKKVQR